eukprot:TRINITY_DN6420_c0_g1_i10.p1 TRINITY_DN6420_c0_g1~~TRINITY_DN6420_c0_g1_i10.p1  ORF type:complete len:986 (+),score=289.67 TRINITY_DN6420_c0_g1_i10:225-2960(+)
MDVLEHDVVQDVVILQTVLGEVKNRSIAVYNRLRGVISAPEKRFFVFLNEHHREAHVEREEGESANDLNDRAIRSAAAFYTEHLSQHSGVSITLITNDNENGRKAREMGIKTMKIAEFVKARSGSVAQDEAAALLNMIQRPGEFEDGEHAAEGAEAGDAAGEAERGAGKEKEKEKEKEKLVYDEYWPKQRIQDALKAGTSVVKAKLNVNRTNKWEGFVSSTLFDSDILIHGRLHLNRAIHGDVVVVEILPRSEWRGYSALIDTQQQQKQQQQQEEQQGQEQETEKDIHPCGRVVGIEKSNWRKYCGSIDPATVTSPTQLFLPVDIRIPKIRIKTTQASVLVGNRITVTIDQWQKTSAFPEGHYTGLIGPIGDKETEIQVILIENDVPFQPFSRNVIGCLPNADYVFVPEENRVDLRHLNICSVDPPGCTDIDDALHAIQKEDGSVEIGVHIADVTHFVHPDTAIDAEAAVRCTTVYLVDRRIDMLPPLLGTNLCSLMSNVDRYAFSVIWQFNRKGEIQSTWFGKTLIRSRASFAYDQAQQRLENLSMTDDLSRDLRILDKFAKILRKKRMENGSLELASPEVHFSLDEDTQSPTDVGVHELKDANKMIEEFMLLANISVAKKIYEAYPQSAILRRHPAPSQSAFEPLKRAAALFGISIDTSTSKTLSESLDKAVLPNYPFFNKLLRILTTRCMTQAIYFSTGTQNVKDFLHYGLACPFYTHFTSPIRRYADVLAHRLLSGVLGLKEPTPALLDRDKMQQQCEVINFRHRMAQQVGRNSVELYTLIFFRGQTVVEEGVVTRVKKNGVQVLIAKYGVESVCYVDDVAPGKTAQTWEYDDVGMTLTGQPSGMVLRVFDRLRIQISIEDQAGMGERLRLQIVEKDTPVTTLKRSAPAQDIAETVQKSKKQRQHLN